MPLSFSSLPQAARVIWAKSGDGRGHGLLAHMLDVAAVAEAIVDREPERTRVWAADALGLQLVHVSKWIAALAGLHDFGKAIPGFQHKWSDGQRQDEHAGLIFSPASLSVNRHDYASTVLLRPLLASFTSRVEWINAVSQAIGAHHGYMPSSFELTRANPRREGSGWPDARLCLFEAFWQVLNPVGAPERPDIQLPVIAWLAGLTSVSDWIGSNQEWFPQGERTDALEEYYAQAKELAERSLDEIGWPGFRALFKEEAETDTLVGRILGRSALSIEARPLQRLADKLLARAHGPTLMIVEAPMGEGKTELAFLAHLRLQAANDHRGLYVALPTQATGNAMFDRATTFLNSFSSDVCLDIQLAHGGAMLDERIHRLRGVNNSAGESIASSAWFSQRKRPLLSPYGVGTVDQALFSILNVKHHFVRLWGLANRLVVLDEVHAYDTYTGGLIEALLRWLRGMNCSVVLMSATLPARRRAAFLRAWGISQEPDIPYPRVLMTCGDRLLGEHAPCRALTPVAVSGIEEGTQVVVQAALDALAGGGCGAVIVNTVQRAQEIYTLLKTRLGAEAKLLLFHARYPADERAERERSVMACFGKGEGARRPPQALLIATQVVEQSLDIDFDFMVSDLAPIDLLLQRAGRLHRHERDRPAAHSTPRLTVAGFTRERLPDLNATKWGFVYDPYVLYRTWGIACLESTWRLPEDIDRLVQAVYSQEPFEEEDRAEFVKTLDRALGEHLADMQDQRQRAINVALEADAEPQNAYSGKPRANEECEGEGDRVVTRLGDRGLSVVPVLEDVAGWRLFPDDAPFDPQTVPDDVLARRIYQRQVRLGRKDIVKALLSQPGPAAFEEHPLLRGLKPLLLNEGTRSFDSVRVHLDSELGITYEPFSASMERA